MPWTISISRCDGLPLGDVSTVQDAVHENIPGIRFWREPSGTEKLAAMKLNTPLPDVIRHSMEKSPSSIQGDYEEDGLSLRLYLGCKPQITKMDIEIRGNGNPMPLIAAICLPNNWIALHGDKILDLAADETEGWQQFGKYRDNVIRRMKCKKGDRN
jgi:hypothetical protein